MWPTREVLLLRARAVMSESKGDAGNAGNGADDGDDNDDAIAKNASSMYLQGKKLENLDSRYTGILRANSATKCKK